MIEVFIFFSIVSFITVLYLIFRAARKTVVSPYFDPWTDQMKHDKDLIDLQKLSDITKKTGCKNSGMLSLADVGRKQNFIHQLTEIEADKTINKIKNTNEETAEEFFDRIYQQKEELDRKFVELMIKLESKKHRFDKLKAPKPKWIHQ